MEHLTYEVLCVDSSQSCIVQTETAVCYSLLSNSNFFPKGKLKGLNKIEDKSLSLVLSVSKVKDDDDLDDQLSNTFLLRIDAPYETVEPFRINLIEHIKKQEFDNIYILTDEVSSHIAQEVYPYINKAENALRKYLMKFLVTKVGPNWWSLSADAEMKTKVNKRKNNEKIFAQVADSSAYLIDFGELGKLVYKQSSGFLSKDDIIDRIANMPETPDAIAELKIELQSNYNKFFKETFKDRNFQSKWESLEKIRHKIAHNNLFTEKDRVDAKSLSDDLLEIINEAENKVNAVKFSTQELDAIKETIAESSELKTITKEQMKARIRNTAKWSKSNKRDFMGLKQFVENYLGNGGFDVPHSYTLMDILAEEGFIRLYDHQGVDHDRTVRAFKLIEESHDTFANRPLEGLKDLIAENA